jgi:50S ribosomal subunit-associated GTPase HflX
LKYVSPRLRESSAGERRQGSGAGESDLDLDRRKIRDRLAELKEQLEDIQRDNDQRRSARSDQLRVALGRIYERGEVVAHACAHGQRGAGRGQALRDA